MNVQNYTISLISLIQNISYWVFFFFSESMENFISNKMSLQKFESDENYRQLKFVYLY